MKKLNMVVILFILLAVALIGYQNCSGFKAHELVGEDDVSILQEYGFDTGGMNPGDIRQRVMELRKKMQAAVKKVKEACASVLENEKPECFFNAYKQYFVNELLIDDLGGSPLDLGDCYFAINQYRTGFGGTCRKSVAKQYDPSAESLALDPGYCYNQSTGTVVSSPSGCGMGVGGQEGSAFCRQAYKSVYGFGSAVRDDDINRYIVAGHFGAAEGAPSPLQIQLLQSNPSASPYTDSCGFTVDVLSNPYKYTPYIEFSLGQAPSQQSGEDGSDDTTGGGNPGGRGPKGGSGGPTNPNSGGAYGCDWEHGLDLSQCQQTSVDNQLETYSNTSACQDMGAYVKYSLHIRGIVKPNQTSPKHEHFSRKNGAQVIIYDFSRSCGGDQVVNQHNDTYYNCEYARNYICQNGKIIPR